MPCLAQDDDITSSALTDYYLSAAAVPGDALSAWLLAAALHDSDDDSKETQAVVAMLLQQAREAASGDARLRAMMALNGDIGTEKVVDTVADDAFVLLLTMSRDEVAKDPAAMQALIRRAADASDYRPAYTAAIRSSYERFRQTEAPAGVPSDESVGDDVGMAAAMTLAIRTAPMFSPWMNACRQALPPLKRDCQRMARLVFERSDLFLDSAMAAVMLERTAEGLEQLDAAKIERRRFVWLQMQILHIRWDKPAAALFSDTLLREGELAAYRAVLQLQGISLEPAADFQPKPLRK